MLADLGHVSHRLDDLLSHKLGVRGQETNTLDSVNLIESSKKVGQVWLVRQVMAVGVHGLAQQGYFFHAPGSEGLHFKGYFRNRAADLTAASVRDDAEGAH